MLYAVCCMLYGMRQQTTVCCKPAGRHSFISQIVQVSFFHKIVWWVPSRHPITTSRGRKWKRRQSRKREEEKRGISFQAQQKRREDEAFKTLGKSSNLDPWSVWYIWKQHDGLNMVHVCGKVLVCINHTVVQVMLPAAIINRCTMYRYKYQNMYSITSIVWSTRSG